MLKSSQGPSSWGLVNLIIQILQLDLVDICDSVGSEWLSVDEASSTIFFLLEVLSFLLTVYAV